MSKAILTSVMVALASGGLGPVPSAAATTSAVEFEAVCQRALGPDATAWFTGELDRVDRLLGDGALDEAEQRSDGAASGLPRTADVSVAVKCVGEPLYARWHEQRRRLRRARAGARPEDWGAQLDGAMARVGAKDAPDAERIADTVPARPNDYGSAIARLRAGQDQVERDRAEGRFVIDAELAEARTGTAAARVLVDRAKVRAERALAAEQASFEGDGPIDDEQLASQVQGAEAMASAMAGLAPEAGRAETQARLLRGRRSRESLREADAWAAVAGDGVRQAVRRRAEQRGDLFRDGGSNDVWAASVRDDHYALAVAFYELAAADARRQAAERARAGLQAGLARERRQREAALNEARDRLAKDAESVQQAAKEMEKTEAEKKAFDDEFDEAFGDMEGFFDE